MPLDTKIGYSCQDARHLSTQKQWDVIVCDVPCSGDGTIRKDPHILPLWKPSQGQLLHTTQLQILLRAFQLAKVGGIICYSTCSLNPVENEAVVAAALHQRAGGEQQQPAFELLEVPTLMKGFHLRPGLSTWRVAEYCNDDSEYSTSKGDDEDDDETPQLTWYDAFEDAHKVMSNPVRSMWPPAKNVSLLHLERCLRLWPQDNDSGGFFLTLIRRNR